QKPSMERAFGHNWPYLSAPNLSDNSLSFTLGRWNETVRRSTIESDQPTIAIRRYVSSRICPANFARVICVAGGPVLRRVIVRAPSSAALPMKNCATFWLITLWIER
ncbi:hypothetical protein QCC20_30150, partial [Pseudomonas aeruginosa]|uniref:hypothetical protein n=2 Tax=Pseudomonas aeruginosa TaxID=287 RepID=UPI0025B43CD8